MNFFGRITELLMNVIEKLISYLEKISGKRRFTVDEIPIPKEPSIITLYGAESEDLERLVKLWRKNAPKDAKDSLLSNKPVSVVNIDKLLEVINVKGGKFEVFQGSDMQWYFNLKSSNGKIVAQSEGYVGKAGALKGIASVKKFAPRAKVIELG